MAFAQTITPDLRPFHTDRDAIDCLPLIHTCTIGGADENATEFLMYASRRYSHLVLTSSAAQLTTVN